MSSSVYIHAEMSVSSSISRCKMQIDLVKSPYFNATWHLLRCYVLVSVLNHPMKMAVLLRALNQLDASSTGSTGFRTPQTLSSALATLGTLYTVGDKVATVVGFDSG